MTITRLWQSGFELQSLLDEVSGVSDVSVVLSTAQKKSGNYAVVCPNSTPRAFYVTFASTAQVRTGFHFRNGTPSSGDAPDIVSFYNGTGTPALRLRWNGTAFTLVAGASTVLATQNYPAFNVPLNWYHISMDIKLNATGWARVYVDGVQVIDFSGNTTGGASTCDRIQYGPLNTSQTWGESVYYDDVLIDDCTGEGAATMAPDRRFDIILVNGNGDFSQWTGSDGNSTDNYLLVDDMPDDADATYVTATTTGLKDTYTTNTITLPSGWSIEAIIPLAFAKKDNAGTALGVKLITRLGSSETASSAKTVGTDYTYIWDRHPLDPGGGAWSQADLNDVQVGIETA